MSFVSLSRTDDDRPIPVFRPSLGEEELEALREIFATGWIGLGPKTAHFEDQFAEYVGAKYAVGLNSGTAALHLALLALGIGPDDEVLLPTLTFVSTAHAVSYCGAVPVFVDVERDTLNVDVADLKRKIGGRSAAIIPVHYGGHPCRMDEIWDIADRYGLLVVEDAAHACGSMYRGRRVGGLRSEATCFSFQAVKNLTTGDGGLVTTADTMVERRLRRLRWCGITKSTWDRSGGREYSWQYEIRELGYKYHMNDIAAAIGLVQLGKLESTNRRRRELAGRYDEAFADVEWIECPVEWPYAHSAKHNYVIKVSGRNQLHQYLKERGVQTGVHYEPLHMQPYYACQGQDRLPVAEEVWTKLLTLPLYPDLSDSDQDRVIAAVLAWRGGD